MGSNEHDRSLPGSIDDTGDLGRIWDELERLAERADAQAPRGEGDRPVADSDPRDPDHPDDATHPAPAGEDDAGA